MKEKNTKDFGWRLMLASSVSLRRALRHTLRALLSVLFYKTTWSEFFQKVSIKRPGLSQKKINRTVLFQQPGLDGSP